MQNLVITNAGQSLMARLIAGETTAKFTRLLASDKDYSGVLLAGLTELEQVKQDELLSDVTVKSDTMVTIQGRIENSSLDTGYYIRALGLIAQDEDGTDVLYAVSIADAVADYMPPFGGTTPTGYSYTFNVKVSNSSAINLTIDPAAVPTSAQVDAIKQMVLTHEGTGIGSEDGVHGLRYFDDKLQYKNDSGEWEEIETGGGSAELVVTTSTAAFVGKTVTVTGEYDNLSGKFDSSKELRFKIKHIGEYTISCQGYSETATVSAIGEVVAVEINDHFATVNVSTSSDEFLSANVVITKDGGAYKTLKFVDGAFSFKTVDTGVYEFTVTYEGKTYSSSLNVSALDKTYAVSVDYIKVYGFKIIHAESDPAAKVSYDVQYNGKNVINHDFTPAKMDYSAGSFDYGSWQATLDEWLMPRPCMVKNSGIVDYYLNPNDYTKKEGGGTSDVANSSYAGNAMVEWGKGGRKIYSKVVPTSDGKGATIYIADGKADNDFKCYPFINYAGDEVDHFYTRIYEGVKVGSTLRSISGVQPYNNETYAPEVTYALANNTDSNKPIWYTGVLCDWMLIGFLHIMLGKSTDVQTVFGLGNSNSYNASASNYNKIATGTMNTKGMFWGSNVSDQSHLNGVKTFGMENWWGNLWERISGWINDNGTQKIKLTYGNQDGSTATGYNATGSGYKAVSDATPSGTSGGYISECKFTADGMFAKVASGSDSTYYPDGLWFNNSQVNVARVGGPCAIGLHCGLAVDLSNAASITYWAVGAALSLKPLKA